jgi:hypothetical protein
VADADGAGAAAAAPLPSQIALPGAADSAQIFQPSFSMHPAPLGRHCELLVQRSPISL